MINVSVDIPNDPRVVKDAIEYAEDRDVVIVAAAGNGGLADVIFPARYSDVMAIAAVDDMGVLAPFSNASDKISLSAPGVHLLGAMPQDRNPAGTALWSGTSFASPLAAGAAALVRAAFPGFDRRAVRNRLESSALSLLAQNPGMGGRLGAASSSRGPLCGPDSPAGRPSRGRMDVTPKLGIIDAGQPDRLPHARQARPLPHQGPRADPPAAARRARPAHGRGRPRPTCSTTSTPT